MFVLFHIFKVDNENAGFDLPNDLSYPVLMST